MTLSRNGAVVTRYKGLGGAFNLHRGKGRRIFCIQEFMLGALLNRSSHFLVILYSIVSTAHIEESA
jgi:hypothetical protein